MDFLNGKIKSMYFKYLSAAFGSAMITSIYSIVDMAMVQGRSHASRSAFGPHARGGDAVGHADCAKSISLIACGGQRRLS